MPGSMDDRDQEVQELRAILDTLVEILISREVLTEGHRRLFDKLRQHAGLSTQRTVRLKVDDDKHGIAGPDIDCAELLPLCRARCCRLAVTLSVQDLEDRCFEWDWDEPYVLKRGDDGYCLKLDQSTGGCSCYQQRPATCRRFDCRTDRRIWLDWDKRIPAPFEGSPPTLAAIEADEPNE